MLCCEIPVADAGGGICRLERRVIPEEMSGDSIVVGALANNEFCPGSVLEDVVGCGRARSDDKVGAATAYGMGSVEVSSFRSSGCQIPCCSAVGRSAVSILVFSNLAFSFQGRHGSVWAMQSYWHSIRSAATYRILLLPCHE